MTSEPMTAEQLAAALSAITCAQIEAPEDADSVLAGLAAGDLLYAEVKRLRCTDPIECGHKAALDQVTKERDEHADLLDRFAYTIAHPDIIGLHSSSNDPWAKALDMVTPTTEVTRLLRLVRDASVFFGIARNHMPDLMAEFERVRAELNDHASASSESPAESSSPTEEKG